MHGKNYNAHRGCTLTHEARGFQPGDALHGDVHEDHVRLLALRELDRFFAARGFTDDSHFSHRAEKRADAGAHQRVIVGKQDPDHQAASLARRRTGNVASNTVPAPGAARSSKLPPASAMRSSMP